MTGTVSRPLVHIQAYEMVHVELYCQGFRWHHINLIHTYTHDNTCQFWDFDASEIITYVSMLSFSWNVIPCAGTMAHNVARPIPRGCHHIRPNNICHLIFPLLRMPSYAIISVEYWYQYAWVISNQFPAAVKCFASRSLSQGKEYLRKWVLETKLTTRIEDGELKGCPLNVFVDWNSSNLLSMSMYSPSPSNIHDSVEFGFLSSLHVVILHWASAL